MNINTAASIEIDTDINSVWNAALDQFGKISLWSSGVYASSPTIEKDTVQHKGFSGRVYETQIGEVKEIFTHINSNLYEFSYRLTSEKFPTFMEDALNSWKLTPLSGSKTKLTMQGETIIKFIPGILLGLPPKLQGNRVLKNNLEEFKHFVETGLPHPKKISTTSK